jgi:PadR family transcriptional regulator, regulatory protein AphA
MIQYILLGFLQYQPMTGYELKGLIDQSTAHFWHAYHSQIYTTLRQMEKDGLISSQFIPGEGQPDRRVYTITESGLLALKEWQDHSMTELAQIKDELLVRVFFSARRDPGKLITELTLQHELHQQKLATYHVIDQNQQQQYQCPPGMERDNYFWNATVRLGIRYEEAYIDWLVETIEMVRRLEKEGVQ